MIAQKPKIELQGKYWPHSHDKNCIWKPQFIAFKWAQERWEWARIGKYTGKAMKWLIVPLLLHHWSKSQNWITQSILATCNIVLKAVIYRFLTSPRTSRMGQNRWAMKWSVVLLLLHHWSKTRNWITQWILATFTSSNFILRTVIYIFLTSPRTPTIGQKKRWLVVLLLLYYCLKMQYFLVEVAFLCDLCLQNGTIIFV